jgi:hypothetical protein
MKNIAPYNENEFISMFKTTEVYKKLKLNYADDQLIWNKFFHLGRKNEFIKKDDETPRETCKKEFSVSIFYYLLPLLEKNPKKIYDLGCGKNMFKPYLPNIIGIGAETPDYYPIVQDYMNVKDPSWPNIFTPDEFEKLPDYIKIECTDIYNLNPYHISKHGFYGDVHGIVNDEYVVQHQNYFESVFAICSLHFHPLSDFKKIVLDFASMICNNGRGFLGINLQRLIDYSSDDFLINQFGTKHPTCEQYDQWLRNELSTTKLKFLILDIDLTLLDELMDGNIRLLIEK